jgi:hypothetical protein
MILCRLSYRGSNRLRRAGGNMWRQCRYPARLAKSVPAFLTASSRAVSLSASVGVDGWLSLILIPFMKAVHPSRPH